MKYLYTVAIFFEIVEIFFVFLLHTYIYMLVESIYYS